jgi:hypothetical protein
VPLFIAALAGPESELAGFTKHDAEDKALGGSYAKDDWKTPRSSLRDSLSTDTTLNRSSMKPSP